MARRLIPQQRNPLKPLGHKGYGHAIHLPGSQCGIGDYVASEGQTRICCERTRDDEDIIVVQEKTDGSNIAVAKINGEIVPAYPCRAPSIEQKRRAFPHLAQVAGQAPLL